MKKAYVIFVFVCFFILNVGYVKADNLGLSIGVKDTTIVVTSTPPFFWNVTFRGDRSASALGERFSELGIVGKDSISISIDADSNSHKDRDVKGFIDEVGGKLLNNDGTMYLYLAGHGSNYGTAWLGLGDKAFWENSDYKLSATELTSYLKPYNSVKKFVFIDSCYAEAFWDDGLKDLEKIFFLAATGSNEETGATTNNGMSIASQTMLEGLEIVLKNGILTYRMDSNHIDGVVTTDEMEKWMVDGINEWRKKPEFDEEGLPAFHKQEFGDPMDPSQLGTPVAYVSPDMTFEMNYGNPVPEPATMLLLGLGLVGLAGVRRRMR